MARAHQGLTLTELIEMLAAAKLELVEIFAVQNTRHYADAGELVTFMEASSFGNLLGGAPEPLRVRLRDDIVAAFEARRGADGIAVTQYGAMAVARRTE
jgi:hypothetical protein